jgi:hypothetical protein
MHRKAVIVVMVVVEVVVEVVEGRWFMFRDGGCKQNTEKVETRAVSVSFPSFGGSSLVLQLFASV